MSNDTQKADQIAFHFYTKLFYAVNDARATEGPRPQSKIDKWFNLETPDSDAFSKDARDRYRSISQAGAGGPPPLEIQVVLAVPELANNEVLVHVSPDSSRVRVEPTPRLIVLETWLLECTPHRPGSADHHANANANPDIALPIIYKHGIVLFRSVFSLLRILPAWKYYMRLRRRTGGRTANLGIQLRVRPIGRDEEEGRILHFVRAQHRGPRQNDGFQIQLLNLNSVQAIPKRPLEYCAIHRILRTSQATSNVRSSWSCPRFPGSPLCPCMAHLFFLPSQRRTQRIPFVSSPTASSGRVWRYQYPRSERRGDRRYSIALRIAQRELLSALEVRGLILYVSKMQQLSRASM